jgi:hypothetical protein
VLQLQALGHHWLLAQQQQPSRPSHPTGVLWPPGLRLRPLAQLQPPLLHEQGLKVLEAGQAGELMLLARVLFAVAGMSVLLAD